MSFASASSCLPCPLPCMSSVFQYNMFCWYFSFRSHILTPRSLDFGFFALAMAAGGLLDDAMAKFGGKSWSLSTLDSPSCTSKNEQDIEDPITISAFIAAVGRSQDGLCQTVNLLFDELLRLKQKNAQTCLRLANLLLQLVHAETCQESCCKVDLHVELSVPYLLKRHRFSQGIMFRVQATGYKIAKGRFCGG